MIAVPVQTRMHGPDLAVLSEVDLVGYARAGDERAIRFLIQRHNQRLFRTARAIVRDDAEAEDVVQATYVRAFAHLVTFRGASQLSTWLTRIALNEALGRMRRRRAATALEDIDMRINSAGGPILHFPSSLNATDPETELSRSEARKLLEAAVDELPDDFRAIFVLRDIEGMSTEEAASCLSIKPETAKTRLHRARRMMRASIEKRLSGAFAELFPFDGARCASMADRVIDALSKLSET